MAQGRAHGKVILLGEHAVVYGVPALVAGLSQGAISEAEPEEADRISFNGQPVPEEHELYRGLQLLREYFEVSPVRLDLRLQVPVGSGLGGSASLGLATARALADLSEQSWTAAQLLSAVHQWEKLFHGNPSGIDAAAAQANRVLCYIRGEEPQQLQLQRPLQVGIAVAGPPAPTKQMVDRVAQHRAQEPSTFTNHLRSIQSLVESAQLCLREGDYSGLGYLMDLNQMLLSTWQVSTPEIEQACRTARQAGALGAKLTGSGGGGCVVALLPDDPEPILQAWRSEGLHCFSCEIGREDTQ